MSKKNNPRTKGLSNKKQKARKMGIDVSDVKITNKLSDRELKALDNKLNRLIKSVNPNYKPKDFKLVDNAPKKEKHKRKLSDETKRAIKLVKSLNELNESIITNIGNTKFVNQFINTLPTGIDTVMMEINWTLHDYKDLKKINVNAMKSVAKKQNLNFNDYMTSVEEKLLTLSYDGYDDMLRSLGFKSAERKEFKRNYKKLDIVGKVYLSEHLYKFAKASEKYRNEGDTDAKRFAKSRLENSLYGHIARYTGGFH